MKKAALISVSNRDGLLPFAQCLSELGYELLCTTGSAKYLKENGLACTLIENYTGQKEILDGRVKTLHPRIHAGLLARMDDPRHVQELQANQILPIEVVVANLYPFSQKLQELKNPNEAEMIEFIDVGGTALMRAASKNFKSVFILTDPTDFAEVENCLRGAKASTSDAFALRRRLAAKALCLLAHDNLEVSKYLSSIDQAADSSLNIYNGEVLKLFQVLRYGENSHQKAALYKDFTSSSDSNSWQQLSGKELSYNNLLDFNAALQLLKSFDSSKPFACIIKHLNPCGAACADNLFEALKRAKLSDPRSHFGGILGFNQPLSLEISQAIREDFAEIVLAPDYQEDALALLRKNKNLRIMRIDLQAKGPGLEFRNIQDGVLAQERDLRISSVAQAQLMTKRAPGDLETRDLEFAWKICAHVKSNAIVLAKNQMLVGVGAGQMSRIDSVELAIHKAKIHGHSLIDSVAASDAFFPFVDSVETLAREGVKGIIAPRGATRDEEVVKRANELDLSLLFANDRHFRH